MAIVPLTYFDKEHHMVMAVGGNQSTARRDFENTCRYIHRLKVNVLDKRVGRAKRPLKWLNRAWEVIHVYEVSGLTFEWRADKRQENLSSLEIYRVIGGDKGDFIFRWLRCRRRKYYFA